MRSDTGMCAAVCNSQGFKQGGGEVEEVMWFCPAATSSDSCRINRFVLGFDWMLPFSEQ